jgi:hypothetical protein
MDVIRQFKYREIHIIQEPSGYSSGSCGEADIKFHFA